MSDTLLAIDVDHGDHHHVMLAWVNTSGFITDAVLNMDPLAPDDLDATLLGLGVGRSSGWQAHEMGRHATARPLAGGALS